MASSFLSHCGSGEKFRDQTYPPFARYIKGQGVDPENPKCVVVAVFFKDRCHLLEGMEFLKVLRELEELNTEALHLPAFAKDRFRFDGVAKKPLGHRERLSQQPSRSHPQTKFFQTSFVS